MVSLGWMSSGARKIRIVEPARSKPFVNRE
jgi:hypothetical protein